MIEDYINNVKFYNNFSFSIEDKITNLFGEVCFYESFVKRFKRQIRLMEKFSKQEMPKKDKGGYYSHSKERKGVEISTIAEHRTLTPILRCQFPLHHNYINPKDKKQVNRWAQSVINYAERSLEHMPLPAILFRTAKESR